MIYEPIIIDKELQFDEVTEYSTNIRHSIEWMQQALKEAIEQGANCFTVRGEINPKFDIYEKDEIEFISIEFWNYREETDVEERKRIEKEQKKIEDEENAKRQSIREEENRERKRLRELAKKYPDELT